MTLFRRPALAALCVLLLSSAALAAASPPPPTEQKTVTDTFFGVTVSDPYRWLEDETDAKVKAFNEAQNGYARSYLDGLPMREALAKKLTALITATSPSYYGMQAAGDAIYGYVNDPKFQQPKLIALPLSADPAAERVVLDPNALDAKGATSIDWFKASHDGKLIAVSLSQGGSEDGTLHIYDAATGKEVDTPIARVQYPTAGGSMAWAADGKGFWYTRYPGDEAPEADRHFNMQVYFHVIGEDAAKDKLILATTDGLPRIAEIALSNEDAPDVVIASVANGDGGDFQHWLIEADGTKHRLDAFADKDVSAVVAADHSVVLVSRKDAPNGKVIRLAPGVFDIAKAETLVPERKAAIIIADVGAPRAPTLTRDHMYVSYIDGGPNTLERFDLDGKNETPVTFDGLVSLDSIEALPDGDVLAHVGTYLRPTYYARIGSDGKAAETQLKVTSPIDFEDAEIVRATATSKDGTQIPISILRKKGLALDGTHPTLVYGYGGYGVSQEPYFLGSTGRIWLDGGGVFAIANIRGGGEYGERWHDEGRLTKKQNVFDDFAAAAQFMVDQKYADHAHLALQGGSNGGLLMGAEITQHPDLAKAVVSQVGIYDMLRVELDPNGSFNTTEFGSVKDEAQFKALYAYSPYHHVTPGTAYPAVLMTTGANDGRVNPMQSRKFAAALQAATGSGLPVLLRISTTSGHGIGSSLSDRIAERADVMSFLFDQLGMTAPAN